MKHAAALSLFSIVLIPLLVQASIGVSAGASSSGLQMEETMGEKVYELTMGEVPEWERISLGDSLEFDLPYSPAWQVDGQSIPSFVTVSSSSVVFGRYRSAGTYITRQYDLNVVPARSFDTIAWQEADGCFGSQPQIQTVGPWRGVMYRYGGAKGCSVNFEIPMNGFNIAVGQMYDIGKDEMMINEEMERVIKSIKVQE